MNDLNHAADTELFGDALTCRERLPADFRADRIGSDAADRAVARAEILLRNLAIAEEARIEDPEERTPADLSLQRVEAKLDLLMDMLGALLRHNATVLPSNFVHWSRRGISLHAADNTLGASGMLRVQPADWLPDVLELPAEVIAVQHEGDATRVWLRFSPLPATLESALERHLFRLHRRQIADARRQRNG